MAGMTVGKALAKAKLDFPSGNIKYVAHARFPDDVLVVTYIARSFVSDIGKEHWEYRLDIWVGNSRGTSAILLSGFDNNGKTKRKPTIRMRKQTK